VEEDREAIISPSPPSMAHSPRSDVSPAPSNRTAHEQAAQETFESEMAEYYLYDLTRRFASATRALAMYDCRKCIDELEQLPHAHQQSPWVLAMVGRAHYERLEYASVRIRSTVTQIYVKVAMLYFFSGGTCLQGRSNTRTTPPLGHGGIFHAIMAPSAKCPAFLSGTRAAQHQPSICAGMDCCGELILTAKGAIASFDVFSEGCTNGPNVCLCVHAEWT
jgi:hypothetical protein